MREETEMLIKLFFISLAIGAFSVIVGSTLFVFLFN